MRDSRLPRAPASTSLCLDEKLVLPSTPKYPPGLGHTSRRFAWVVSYSSPCLSIYRAGTTTGFSLSPAAMTCAFPPSLLCSEGSWTVRVCPLPGPRGIAPSSGPAPTSKTHCTPVPLHLLASPKAQPHPHLPGPPRQPRPSTLTQQPDTRNQPFRPHHSSVTGIEQKDSEPRAFASRPLVRPACAPASSCPQTPSPAPIPALPARTCPLLPTLPPCSCPGSLTRPRRDLPLTCTPAPRFLPLRSHWSRA